jgi:hypothetical protein
VTTIHTAIVCGGREGVVPPDLKTAPTRDQLAQWAALGRFALTSFREDHATELQHVVVGSKRGCDWLAFQWATDHEIDATVAPAKWSKQKRAAGPIRNRRMLDVYQPQAVLALPGGRGTADMMAATYERVAVQQSAFDFARPADAVRPALLQLWQCAFDFDALGFEWKRAA